MVNSQPPTMLKCNYNTSLALLSGKLHAFFMERQLSRGLNSVSSKSIKLS